MKNLLFTISFDGSRYHGWQIQENAVTVQQTVKDAFQKITGEQANIIGCSRTDSGVHAKEFCFSVKTLSNISEKAFPAALNSALPFDISARGCVEVPEDFNARYSCRRKEYEYLIYNGSYRSPFYVDKALHYSYPLDVKALSDAAGLFVGKHDFSAFCSAHSEVLSKERTVFYSDFTNSGDCFAFRVCADGFLYNMVRIMVGTLLNISEGKLSANSIPDIILSQDRSRAGFTAPPQGLYLNKVYYDKGVIPDE